MAVNQEDVFKKLISHSKEYGFIINQVRCTMFECRV